VTSADDSGVVTTGSLFPARGRRSAWPSLHGDVIAAVFLGGCAGGYLRYAIARLWPPADGRFPWATFGVNTVGAFILGLVVVIAAELVPSRYLRPLVGTGFCGALTTFSAVVVSTDQLFAHHHRGLAASYLLASIGCGLAAGWIGLLAGRAISVDRPRERERRNSP
jgi:CrcB protein